MNLLTYGLLFLAGIAAGVMNTVGGGGSVLTLPALIFMGIPADAANATNRIGIIAQNVVALRQFRRSGIRETGLSWRLAVVGVIGCVIGARIAVIIPPQQFERILGWFMLGFLALILKKPKAPLTDKPAANDNYWPLLTRSRKIVALSVFFGLGIYSGFLQAGVGILILIALGYIVHMDLVRANYIKLLYILVCMPVALATFMAGDVRIYWTAGLVVTSGQMIGAYAGSWVAIKKGEKWILVILAVSIILSSGKLLDWF